MRNASLPMYDLPAVRAATDAFWAALAGNLRRQGLAEVPEMLIHDRPVGELWSDPHLLISQCCGLDVRLRYRDRLLPIATPRFAVPGCEGGTYCSLVVVAEDSPFDDVRDMYGTVAVINGRESHSGMSSLRHLVAERNVGGRFFADVKVSGSHAGSLELVRRGEADVAAIDCVTLTLIQRTSDTAMRGIRVLGDTYHAPAPPYVVLASCPPDHALRIRAALVETFEDRSLAECREVLLLKGIALTSIEDYSVLDTYQSHADGLGYPVLQ